MGTPYHKLEAELKGRVLRDEPLSKHTSFGIGGPADLFVFPGDLEDLREVLKFCNSERSPLFIMGNGTDLLVRDGRLRGIVISLKDGFRNLKIESDNLACGGGVNLPDLLSLASQSSLGGIEFLAGIPGTVGGAIKRNAGAWGGEISQVVNSVRGMNPSGELIELKREEIGFGYRESHLPEGLIILEVTLRLRRDGGEELIRSYLLKREETQPLWERSAGSIFRNPEGNSAGRLIELAGCKGMSIGGAQVSPKHANFIVNLGKATSEDVLALIDKVRGRVKEETGVELELEIEVWGEP